MNCLLLYRGVEVGYSYGGGHSDTTNKLKSVVEHEIILCCTGTTETSILFKAFKSQKRHLTLFNQGS